MSKKFFSDKIVDFKIQTKIISSLLQCLSFLSLFLSLYIYIYIYLSLSLSIYIYIYIYIYISIYIYLSLYLSLSSITKAYFLSSNFEILLFSLQTAWALKRCVAKYFRCIYCLTRVLCYNFLWR